MLAKNMPQWSFVFNFSLLHYSVYFILLSLQILLMYFFLSFSFFDFNSLWCCTMQKRVAKCIMLSKISRNRSPRVVNKEFWAEFNDSLSFRVRSRLLVHVLWAHARKIINLTSDRGQYINLINSKSHTFKPFIPIATVKKCWWMRKMTGSKVTE